MRPTTVAVIAAIICIPILFAALGGTQEAGLIIGVVLVVGGVAATLRGAR